MDFRLGFLSSDISGRLYSPGCLLGSSYLSSKTADFEKRLDEKLRKLQYIEGVNDKGLESVAIAFRKSLLSHCNKGFFRKDAYLQIFFITDNDDLSTHPVSYYKRIFGLYRERGTGPYIVVLSPKQAIHRGALYSRYRESSVSRSGVHVLEEKCWFSCGCISLGLSYYLYLSELPERASLKIWVNGKPLSLDSRYFPRYELSRNAINLCISSFCNQNTCRDLPPNARITIKYQPVCIKP